MNSSTLSMGLLSVFILWPLPAFWSQDIIMYLVLSAFTSSPISLVAATKVSAFFFTVCTLPPNILTVDKFCNKRYLMRKLVGHGHKLYMDNFFSLSDLFDNLTKRKISGCCCRTSCRGKINWNVVILFEGLEVYWQWWSWKRTKMYTYGQMCTMPGKCNMCNEHGNTIQPTVI